MLESFTFSSKLPWQASQLRDSIVVSISACHAEDPGSIPGRGILYMLVTTASNLLLACTTKPFSQELLFPVAGLWWKMTVAFKRLVVHMFGSQVERTRLRQWLASDRPATNVSVRRRARDDSCGVRTHALADWRLKPAP